MATTSSSFPILSLPWNPKPTSRIRNGSSRFRVAAVAVGETQKNPPGNLHYNEEGKKEAKDGSFGGLGVLYDDGFGTQTVKDYFAAAKEIIKPDGGPPRWFCPVECGKPIKNAPVLFFLPGVDGTGMGLTLHHKSLGKVFEVRCLHIPVNDRTQFEGLVKFVENTVKDEHALFPSKPIYLVGDSFGGCLALSVAARNPSIDLVLILVNPATSYNKSQLQPFIPILEALPHDLHASLPYVLSFVMCILSLSSFLNLDFTILRLFCFLDNIFLTTLGDPVKMAMAGIVDDLSLQQTMDELSKTLTSLLPLLSDLTDILPKDTFLWKLKLLKSGTAYTNSRLHAVQAEVLMLASGKDNLLPSGSEANRLQTSLKHCRVRYYKDNGHTLLLEDGINLLSVIKGTTTYRHSKQHDFVTDYLPPTISEFKREFGQNNRLFSIATSPVFLSTLKNGKIVRGLGGVPDEGPVLLVGYHMLLGLELGPLYEAFLREKNVIIRGMAHPYLFMQPEASQQEFSRVDGLTIFGALPVSPINMYRLLSRKSFVLLYPGGAREALHRKGEEYKLFWPDQPEFVRMAARFNATIVPFGVVGEDDVAEVVLDYDDLIQIPFMQRFIKNLNQDVVRLRTDKGGEIANQDLHIPGVIPKVPGRFYFLFGKPFEIQGNDILKDRKRANEVYMGIKSETEGLMSYLKKKREEDLYRGIIPRAIYQNSWGSSSQVPTFDP